jgi:hypothetical protein
MSDAEKQSPAEMNGRFLSLTAKEPSSDQWEFWNQVRSRTHADQAEALNWSSVPQTSAMETGVSIIQELDAAPPRTLHNAAIVRSSPLPLPVRRMFEQRGFGRPYDTSIANLDSIQADLPGLKCPPASVSFLGSTHTFENLNYSVDCLLQHRKRLLASLTDPSRPRKHVLVLGAGPGGLMTAVQLGLRNHHVVVCEQRETYTRNRYIGVYKEVTHLMAALGMPECMTYDFSQYRGKRGIMVADIQTFLHGIALKLGVIIYTGAVPRSLSLPLLCDGELELQRDTQGAPGIGGESSVGMVRWRHDSVSRVRSGVRIRFDTIIEATGGRSGLRELLVGPGNIVSLKTLGRSAATWDPTLTSFFEDPEDHCAEYVESGYGCPPGLRKVFAEALLSGGKSEIPDEIPCFVSNIEASIFLKPMQATPTSLGLASRIEDRNLDIPHDWVVLECRLSDQSLSRYHIEGPLPQTYAFGGKRLATRESVDKLNPVSLLFRILYAMGVPFDAVDRRRLIDFTACESSYGDSSDIVSTWIGRFRGLRLGGEEPIWRGHVPGSESVEYGIVGEALQNAWYRFGVGVDDAFAAAELFAEGLDVSPEVRIDEARRFERVMTSRSVQILYHLFGVARNTDEGVVGPVLTEYHMDQQHWWDLAEARLRDLSRRGSEMLGAATDLCSDGSLIEFALDYQRDGSCQTALTLLESFAYPRELLTRATQTLRQGGADSRSLVFAALEGALSAEHRELLLPLFQAPGSKSGRGGRCEERLVELALGRYAWASPWVRSCALRALDPASPAAQTVFRNTAEDSSSLVAETAAALRRAPDHAIAGPESLTIDRVVLLRNVGLFKEIPHEVLAGVAALLSERWVDAEERIFEKGDLGDCLYVIGSGRVRIHDGDYTLDYLQTHAVFGELSLLDAEPRSASVSAVERTHLFRLTQAAFYSLAGDRIEITRAINRVLCGKIRKANAMATAKHQY